MKKFSLNLTDQQKVFLATLLPKGYSLTETNSAASDLHSAGHKSNVKNKYQTFREGDESSKSSNSHQSAPQNKSKTSTPTKASKIILTEEKTIKKSQKVSTQNAVIKKGEKAGFFNLLLDQIQKKKSASIFIEPVDPIKLGIPNYFDIIKYPMAIETMRSKVKQGKYIKFSQFEKDLQQISSNCVKFNAGNNYFVQMANKFQMEFIKILEKYNKKVDSLFNEDESKNYQDSKNIEQNSEQQTNSQAEITRKNIDNKKSKKLEKIQRKNLHKEEINQQDIIQDKQGQKKIDSKSLRPSESNNKDKIVKESACLKIGKAKETQKTLENKIESQSNNDQNKNERKDKQEKEKNSQKVKEKKMIRIKKYSYQDRLEIISRIKKLDRATMSRFFEEINFSKGESLDFKVLEDDKIKEMEIKLKKYEVIHQEKLRKIQELNKGKSTSQDFEIEEDKDYED